MQLHAILLIRLNAAHHRFREPAPAPALPRPLAIVAMMLRRRHVRSLALRAPHFGVGHHAPSSSAGSPRLSASAVQALAMSARRSNTALSMAGARSGHGRG